MGEQTHYDPVLGAAAQGTFALAPAGGAVRVGSGALREGLLCSLWSAELMAAAAGLVPYFQVGGQKGVAVLGGARSRLSKASEGVRTIYLAAHGAARQASAHARLVSGEQAYVGDIGDFGVSVVITVIGVAAVVATAWFAKGAVEKLLETRAEDIRASYAANTAAGIAAAELASGKDVSPEVWSILKGVADRERTDGWMPYALAGGGAIVLGAGLFALHQRQRGNL